MFCFSFLSQTYIFIKGNWIFIAENGRIPKQGRMGLWQGGKANISWSVWQQLHNMHTQADWGLLSLTLITTAAKFESASIKDGSSLQQEQRDLRCFLFSSLHHFLSVFYPQGCSRLSPKASWLNAYLLGKLWLVCACVCQREWVRFGANECVSNCGPGHHGESFNRVWGEDEKEGQECTTSRKDEKSKYVSKYVKRDINFHP